MQSNRLRHACLSAYRRRQACGFAFLAALSQLANAGLITPGFVKSLKNDLVTPVLLLLTGGFFIVAFGFFRVNNSWRGFLWLLGGIICLILLLIIVLDIL